jgi:hypothetical protein
MNLGVPLNGTRHHEGTTQKVPAFHIDTTITATTNFDNLEPKEELSFMIEPRIGVIIPVVDNQTGWLGVTAIVGYSLNRVTKPVDIGGQTFEDPHQLFSVHLGLTWQFGIPGTGGN